MPQGLVVVRIKSKHSERGGAGDGATVVLVAIIRVEVQIENCGWQRLGLDVSSWEESVSLFDTVRFLSLHGFVGEAESDDTPISGLRIRRADPSGLVIVPFILRSGQILVLL
jgi:hypothetical protein